MDQGQLWAGTPSGLFTIDPLTDLYTRTLPYETTGGVYLLLPLDEGHLWVEAERGHFYYDGDRWSQVLLPNTTSDHWTSMMMVNPQGDLLIEHITGNSRESSQYHLLGHAPPGDAWPLAWEKPDWDYSTVCPWQAFTNGYASYATSAECALQTQAITTTSPYHINNSYQRSTFNAAMDRDGSVWWIASEDSTPVLNHAVDGRWITSRLSTDRETYRRQFSSPLAPDPVHGVWRGTQRGLIYTDGENTREINFAPEPCAVVWPNDLAVDASGNVWLGTTVGQILKQVPTDVAWTSVPLSNLPRSELQQPIMAIAAAPDGTLWATHGYDVFKANYNDPTAIVSLEVDNVLDHLIATSDSVWGWSYNWIWQFDISRQKWRRHDLDPKIVSLLIVDSNGALYAGGWNGLYRYVDSTWQQVATVDVTVAAADKRGGLWLASGLQGNLWYYRDGQLTPLGRPFNPNGVWHLTVDNQNHPWAAYPDALVRYDGKNWRYIHSPVQGIEHITADPAGRIWVAGRHSTSALGAASLAVYDPALATHP